jgi:hypothetical protein
MGAVWRKKVNGQHSTCDEGKLTGCFYRLADDGSAGVKAANDKNR